MTRRGHEIAADTIKEFRGTLCILNGEGSKENRATQKPKLSSICGAIGDAFPLSRDTACPAELLHMLCLSAMTMPWARDVKVC